jgi:hemoglobin
VTATLYAWAGGGEAFERLIDAFHDRVERDELLSPLFPGVFTRSTACTSSRGGRRSSAPRRVRRGARLALHNSQPGAEVAPHAPVRRWGWGEAPPYVP